MYVFTWPETGAIVPVAFTFAVCDHAIDGAASAPETSTTSATRRTTEIRPGGSISPSSVERKQRRVAESQFTVATRRLPPRNAPTRQTAVAASV